MEVQFIDYGNRENVKRESMKAMTSEFMKLPIQAITCSLNGVNCAEDSMWDGSQVSTFYDMSTQNAVVSDDEKPK